MDLDNGVVHAWKSYAPQGASAPSPVSSYDIDDVARGGVIGGSWQWSFSCCDTTLCSDCSIH
ncbi:hypothetical protein VSR01_03795 [Actinacidiphila sp. DG2A-62]|uniref:hypothetical protein n=1 Tax=Actinacidiphila sp. DG2A-62 TaxID=3108821 RepID=UPI002DBBB4CE|nr:hypothetical protein [Actinacidiphila sp. DG2A-62]MEC3992718.1 hypothetical protein [Actinacidiphila sp. DG2A-62]